ncbi:heme uptake transmembrane sensor [Bordetella pertussis]|nr:heme uptake transmembrane sensor [Bordetella pertussis]
MHPAGPLNPPGDDAPIERRVAREAARWLVRLGSGQASADEIQACRPPWAARGTAARC